MEEGKICSKCGKWKALNDYYFRKERGKYRTDCKKCCNERSKQYMQDNIEQIKKQRKQYYLENIELDHARGKKWREKNRERNIEYMREWRQNNVEKIRQYYRSDKGKENTRKKNLKRRSYNQKVYFTSKERISIFDRDKWECQMCGCKVHDRKTGNWNTPDKANIDHIIPLSKGGTSHTSNLQTLCRTCNSSKQANIDSKMG